MKMKRMIFAVAVAGLMLIGSVSAQATPLRWEWAVPGDDSVILLEGDIVPGSADGFRELLQSSSMDNLQEVIILNSPGGDPIEAMAIGQMIRDRGLSTFTAGECVSACVYMSAAGNPRLLSKTGMIGVHWVVADEGYSSAAMAEGVQTIHARAWDYFNTIPGVKAEALMYLTLTSGKNVHFLSKNEAINAGWTPTNMVFRR